MALGDIAVEHGAAPWLIPADKPGSCWYSDLDARWRRSILPGPLCGRRHPTDPWRHGGGRVAASEAPADMPPP